MTLDIDTTVIRETYLPFGKPDFSDEEVTAITRALRSGWVGMGPETISFERELAEYLDVPHVVTVNSCTSAMFLALLVQGIQPGDEVICPSLTWCSTANVALYLGAKPVFCDVDPHTLCVTPDLIQAKLTSKTKAVMIVHYGGLAVDSDAIRQVLPDHVVIIEDAAHALGARYPNGRAVGASKNLTCFSFYANKNLSTGEGGAISLHDSQLAERLHSLRLHALPIDAWKRFSNPKSLLKSAGLTELGYKMNYTDLQACIGRVQLKRQSEMSIRRLDVAKCYVEHLSYPNSPIQFQADILHPYHARHLFVIQLEQGHDRDVLMTQLRSRNIGASIHYAPLHTMPLYNTENSQCALPVTEGVCENVLTLPISASMTLEDSKYVVTHIKQLIQ